MTQAWRAFIDVVPVLALAGLVALPVAGWLVRRRVHQLEEPWAAACRAIAVPAASAATLLVVAAITLVPTGAGTSMNLVPFATISDQVTSAVDASVAVRNVAFNVLLFVPVGWTWALMARQRGRPWPTAVVAGISLSVLVELLQLLLPLGRAVDIDDVILNSVGVLLGAAFPTVGRITFRRLERATT